MIPKMDAQRALGFGEILHARSKHPPVLFRLLESTSAGLFAALIRHRRQPIEQHWHSIIRQTGARQDIASKLE
jgi:hypothetical protein